MLASFIAVLAVLPGAAPFGTRAAAADGIDLHTHATYTIRPDEGPVKVSWDATITDNDPSTPPGGNNGTVSFYDTVSLPVLRSASNVAARSAEGAALDVVQAEAPSGPFVPVRIKLDRRLFFHDTYSLHLEYQVTEARQPSLLVASAYAYVPIAGAGDETTVDVILPQSTDPWDVSLERGNCAQNGTSFTCSGSDGVYVVALAEVSRPDKIATSTAEIGLRDKNLNLTITYFQGDDAFAQHVKDVATAGLPVIERLYGVNYSGPAALNIAERGREVILGYEGLTKCDPSKACDVAVSPVADDYTVLHELSHLWSGMYSERWLAEGFAQLISGEAAPLMPSGLVRGTPPEHPQPTVELQLDEWGQVQSAIGADEAALARENAGYYRSQRFLAALEFELGADALQKANRAIAQSGSAADSRRYMDALEEASGRNNDDFFRQWVFPSSLAPTLAKRRQARDSLTNLIAKAQEEKLSDSVPARIQEKVAAWQFDDALTALADAQAGLALYSGFKEQLEALSRDAQAAGLAMGDTIQTELHDWDFARARDAVSHASEALNTYKAARSKLAESRNFWEQIGILGSDADGKADEAAEAFNRGDYARANSLASDAIDSLDGASGRAAQRVLLLAGGLGAFALIIFAAVWLSHLRQRALAEP